MIIFLFRFSSQIFCQRNFGAWILDNDATFITLKHNKSGFQGKNHSFIECSKLFVLMRFLNGRLEMVYQKKIICKHFAILKCFTVHILHTRCYLRSKWFSGIFAANPNGKQLLRRLHRFIDENFLCNNHRLQMAQSWTNCFSPTEIKICVLAGRFILSSVQWVHHFKKCHIHNGYSKVNGLKWTPSWSEECKCELI